MLFWRSLGEWRKWGGCFFAGEAVLNTLCLAVFGGVERVGRVLFFG